MWDAIQLGTELHASEHTWPRRLLVRAFGHRGLGYAVKLWALKQLLSRVASDRIQRVLDFGCGTGSFTVYLKRQFPAAELSGVDGDPDAVKSADQGLASSRSTSVQFSATRFDVYGFNDKYDLVVSLDSLYYTSRGVEFLEGLCQSVNPGGYLVVSCPRLRRYYGRGFHYYLGWVDVDQLAPLYKIGNLKRVIEDSGLEIVDEVHYPGRLAGRLIERQKTGGLFATALYPLTLPLVWLTRAGQPPISTHFMLLAHRPIAAAKRRLCA